MHDGPRTARGSDRCTARCTARILDALDRDGDRPVLHATSGSTTAGALSAAVAGAVQVLSGRGVGPGQTVAVLTATNRPATLAARYAAHLLGAATAHIRSNNPRGDDAGLAAAQQRHLLDATGSTVLVVDAEHLDRGRELVAVTGPRCALAALEPLGDDVLQLRSTDPGPLPVVVPADTDVAVIGTTSGTSSQPRATCHTFAAWGATVASFPGAGDAGGPGTLLVVTPLSHTVAPMADAVLAAGGTLVLHDHFDADGVWRAIGEHRVTDVYVAVPHLNQLLDAAARTTVDTSSLRRVIYSGSPAAPRRIAAAVGLLGASLVQLYGTTEAGGIASLTALDHAEPELHGTVGRPFPWVDVELREPGRRTVVPRGETGQVWVRSSTVMAGYLDDVDGTAAVLQDGWLDTGDLGRWDAYGYLHLRGRTGDVIKSRGLKVHPAAVEVALLEHEDVVGAAAFGAMSSDDVESVHAVVVLRPGATGTVDGLRVAVGRRLDPAHVPTTLVVLDRIPLTPSGKADRARLRAAVDRAVAGPGAGRRRSGARRNSGVAVRGVQSAATAAAESGRGT